MRYLFQHQIPKTENTGLTYATVLSLSTSFCAKQRNIPTKFEMRESKNFHAHANSFFSSLTLGIIYSMSETVSLMCGCLTFGFFWYWIEQYVSWLSKKATSITAMVVKVVLTRAEKNKIQLRTPVIIFFVSSKMIYRYLP